MVFPICCTPDSSTSEPDECVDGILSITQGHTQLPSPLIARTENLPKRNCGSSQFRADRLAQEPILVENADFGHVSGIKPQSDCLADIGR